MNPLSWAMILLLVLSAALHAQILQGNWVDQTEQDIDAHRKTEIRVVVLDRQGQPVPDVVVHVKMLQHAFRFGIHLDRQTLQHDGQVVFPSLEAPFWRCFNAVALDPISRWPRMQPTPGPWHFQSVDQVLVWAHTQRLAVRWGGVISSDPDRLPTWAVELSDMALRDAMETHLRQVMANYGRHVEQFDVLTHTLDHHLVTARLGQAMVRRLYEIAKAQAPHASIAARFENALTGMRRQQMIRAVTALRETFTPIDLIVIDQQITGPVVQASLARELGWVGQLGLPVVIGRLEVSGTSPADAAINLETMMRTLFAEPTIQGIYFAGLTTDQVRYASALLLDQQGQPTPAGQVIDGLIHQQWWTDLYQKTDELGNVQTRVFAGIYQISTKLPDGSKPQLKVYLPVSDQQRMVILQPLDLAVEQEIKTHP